MNILEPTADPPNPVNRMVRARADLRLYQQLYRLTEPCARAAFAEKLTRRASMPSALAGRADSLTLAPPANDVSSLLQRMMSLLGRAATTVPDERDPHALPRMDSAEREELQTALRAHGDQTPTDPLSTLSQQLAAEFSRALWSSLIDAALAAARTGPLRVGDWLPGWPKTSARTSPLVERLTRHLGHFGLGSSQVVQIAQQAARAWMNEAPAGVTSLQLPQGLVVDGSELSTFLDEQEALQRPDRATSHPGHRAPASEASRGRMVALSASAAKRRPKSN